MRGVGLRAWKEGRRNCGHFRQLEHIQSLPDVTFASSLACQRNKPPPVSALTTVNLKPSSRDCMSDELVSSSNVLKGP